jgi:acylphosphatase
MPPLEARRFVVRGRVQAVGFRLWTRRLAIELGLAGWVRNLPDGRSVEAFAQGEATLLATFRAALHEGPPGAVVTEFEKTAAAIVEGADQFEVWP